MVSYYPGYHRINLFLAYQVKKPTTLSIRGGFLIYSKKSITISASNSTPTPVAPSGLNALALP